MPNPFADVPETRTDAKQATIKAMVAVFDLQNFREFNLDEKEQLEQAWHLLMVIFRNHEWK